MSFDTRPEPAGRGRGRPIGSDCGETRAGILRAARDVINDRGYEAATFQAIAERAGLSRPTMHYYFHTREEIYDSLVQEASSIVADCINEAVWGHATGAADCVRHDGVPVGVRGAVDDEVHHRRPAGVPSKPQPSAR